MVDEVVEGAKGPNYAFRQKVFIAVMGSLIITGGLFIVVYKPADTPPPADTISASASAATVDPRQGEAIDYMDYYVTSQTGGVTIGKRYNFVAIVSQDFTIKNPDVNKTGVPHFLQGADAFDSKEAREQFLRISDDYPKRVVVEMGSDGITLVHDVHSSF